MLNCTAPLSAARPDERMYGRANFDARSHQSFGDETDRASGNSLYLLIVLAFLSKFKYKKFLYFNIKKIVFLPSAALRGEST